MSITGTCGVHCGIVTGHEGHCDCGLCHDGTAAAVTTRSESGVERTVPVLGHGTPVCDQWYARAGDYRPWHTGQHQPLTGDQLPVLDRLIPARWMGLDALTCPQCGDKTFLDAADPDDDLAAFWHHLGQHTQHTQDPVSRLRLWTAAMGAEKGTK